MVPINIGCSGFSYKHWKKVFYPEGLPESGWLRFYSSVFATVELNVTFYHLPSQSAFRSWYETTPPDFRFAVKGSRYITHIKRITDVREPLQRFFEAAFHLNEKMSVVLWQFPPAFRLNLDRLESFLLLLKHFSVRHAFEFRHESWVDQRVFDVLRRHNACMCMADSPPFLDDLPITSDFVYIRRHGQAARHSGRYDRSQLAADAARIKAWRAKGLETFMYFNNDAFGYAPANARELMEMLGSVRSFPLLKKPA